MMYDYIKRFGLGFRLAIATTLAVVLAISAAVPASAVSGSGSGGNSPDFALSVNYMPPSFVGHMIRGGLTECSGCTTSVEPRYLVNSAFGSFFDVNTISLVSLNDF